MSLGWKARMAEIGAGQQLLEAAFDLRAAEPLLHEGVDLERRLRVLVTDLVHHVVQRSACLEHRAVHLLPAFDQYLLGPGTNDPVLVPPDHRGIVSRVGGWISPVVLLGGRVAGTREAIDGVPLVKPLAGAALPARELDAAVARMAALLGAAAGADKEPG